MFQRELYLNRLISRMNKHTLLRYFLSLYRKTDVKQDVAPIEK